MESKAIVDRAYLTALPHHRFFEIISSCMEEEGAAIQQAASLLSDSVLHLAKLLISSPGRTFFTGIGKSGIVARKLSTIGASLGLQTFFLDPLNALHGDSGVCLESDILIIVSRSAAGTELASLITLAHSKKVYSVVISCKMGPLSAMSTHNVVVPCTHEADEYNVVPTNSSAVLTAFGDGLLLALAAHKGFHVETFAQHHPGGSLGKRLTARLEEVMVPASELPQIREEEPLANLLLSMHYHQRSLGVVISTQKEVTGVITSETLRELYAKKESMSGMNANYLSNPNYPAIPLNTPLPDVFATMKTHAIPWMLVIENNHLKGLVELKTLLGRDS